MATTIAIIGDVTVMPSHRTSDGQRAAPTLHTFTCVDALRPSRTLATESRIVSTIGSARSVCIAYTVALTFVCGRASIAAAGVAGDRATLQTGLG